jgi:hypothetical protein
MQWKARFTKDFLSVSAGQALSTYLSWERVSRAIFALFFWVFATTQSSLALHWH